ncbi:MAG: protein kinase domain-containing protein [Deinococcales bacterium]
MSDLESKPSLLAGRYALREPVGEGGMAVVWRAYDSVLKRDVALKVLHEYVPPTDRQRFRREIRTLARLAHPNIIGIYDLGEEDGRAFFTMELLTGGYISSLGALEDNVTELERFLQVAKEAALGLAYIHEAKLVHRDLTPRNILLDSNGHPRIMDFGLVYVSDATRDLTRTGYTLGTPQYMAPEQAKGTEISAKSDLYSFGAVLYRAATGVAPFEADNDQGVLYQHVYEAPKPLEMHNPNVPKALSETILEFLHKDPQKRPNNAPERFAETAERLQREHYPAQYRAGRCRTGVYAGGVANPSRLERTWQADLGSEVVWGSAITGAHGLLALGTRGGTMCLLEAATGTRRAEFATQDELTAPASFLGDTLVFASWDGITRAINWKTQKLLWAHKGKAEIASAPTAWGNHWLVAARDGTLCSLHNGKLEWSFKSRAAFAASPLCWAGSAILADEDGQISAINLQNGKRIWELGLEGVQATPCIARNPNNPNQAVLLIASWQGEVTALELCHSERGWLPEAESRWEFDLEGEVWGSPALCGQQAILTNWQGEAGVVRALSVTTGDELWTHSTTGRLTSSPIISRGVVYVLSEVGELLALRLEDGMVLWSQQLEAGVQATPLVMGGGLFVATLEGQVIGYF